MDQTDPHTSPTFLDEALAPSTVELTVNMLKAIFAAAVLDRLVGSSPVVRLALPKADNDRIVPLTVDQVLELAQAVPVRTRAMVLAQAGLGLRLGELLALRQQDVNFLGRTARVEHQLEDRTRSRVEPKTPRSRRTIPLPQFVADALAWHMQQWPPLEDGSLFYGHNRRPYHHAFYGVRTFKAAVKKLAGEEGSTFPLSTTTHDLRHHYASVLLAGGESVVAVAERLGHDDASMVLKVYGHLMPDSEDRTRKIIDAAWSGASAEVSSMAVGDRSTDSVRTERGMQ
jgi:integrase